MSTNILDKRKSFGRWVNETRIRKALTLDKVAELSKGTISKSYVGHIETGKVLPSDITLKKLIALAGVLELSPFEFVNIALRFALDLEVKTSVSEKIIKRRVDTPSDESGQNRVNEEDTRAIK